MKKSIFTIILVVTAWTAKAQFAANATDIKPLMACHVEGKPSFDAALSGYLFQVLVGDTTVSHGKYFIVFG